MDGRQNSNSLAYRLDRNKDSIEELNGIQHKDSIGELDFIQREDFHDYGNNYDGKYEYTTQK